jgi:hypothetical protein
VNSTLVGLVLGCASLCSAQGSSPRPSENVDVQRLFKFSGAITCAHRPGSVVGTVALRFSTYNGPNGGEACWQETQNVLPETEGHDTVLLGESALRGVSGTIFASRGTHWLGVQASGQPEEPRILLVEPSSALEAEPVSPSTSVGESATPYNTTQRYLGLILSMMFLVGAGMAYGELRNWWKARTEQYGEPPFANLLRFVPNPDSPRCAQRLRYLLSGWLRSIRGRFEHSTKIIDRPTQTVDNDQPTKAA